jgi:uncharacterized membrane protein
MHGIYNIKFMQAVCFFEVSQNMYHTSAHGVLCGHLWGPYVSVLFWRFLYRIDLCIVGSVHKQQWTIEM